MTEVFAEKSVLITGAGSGFGRIIAQEFSRFGANLTLGDINEAGLAETVRGLTGDARSMVCNVTAEDDQRALARLAKDSFGRLDIAINNAGIVTDAKPFLEATEAEFDLNFAVNVKGVFFGMKHQIPIMLEQREGSILNVSSVAGLSGARKLAPYVASKHAVIGLTKTAAIEYAKSGIRVNAICPFFSPTPMVTESVMADQTELLQSGTPMKRLGTPEEMVAAMIAILNPANSYMTGQAIAVDGGVTAN